MVIDLIFCAIPVPNYPVNSQIRGGGAGRTQSFASRALVKAGSRRSPPPPPRTELRFGQLKLPPTTEDGQGQALAARRANWKAWTGGRGRLPKSQRTYALTRGPPDWRGLPCWAPTATIPQRAACQAAAVLGPDGHGRQERQETRVFAEKTGPWFPERGGRRRGPEVPCETKRQDRLGPGVGLRSFTAKCWTVCVQGQA